MKNKLIKILSLLSLVLVPILVLADDLEDLGLFETLMMHFMLTLHSLGFVCLPVSTIFASDKAAEKELFWKVFWARAIIVVILSFISAETSIIVDVASIFIGGFVGFPLSAIISGVRRKKGGSELNTLMGNVNNTKINCSKCGEVIVSGNSFCINCGTKSPINNNNVLTLPSGSQGSAFGAAKIFGYNMSEEQMVEEIIKREMSKTGQGYDIPIVGVEKRKNILTFIYAIILTICVSLFFFHSNTVLLIFVFLIVTIIYLCVMKNYNLLKYLKKEVKSRPDEKIGYIVSTVLEGKTSSGSYKFIRYVLLIIAIIIPLFIFKSPHVIYEMNTTLDGYVIRFYTIGWLENDTKLEIPSEYEGKSVVGIRGDVFANVHTIEKVVLPDTIKEIRGGAFKNAVNLEEINLPEGISEISGETFQNCYSLKEITIPDSVTRIGGHAFRDNSSLSKVNISANSKLKEIGSSAFRDCYKLKKIYLPRNIDVNERAFKGSGTDVKEYSEDGTILEEEYEFERSIYLSAIGSSDTVYTNYEDSIIKDGTISLKEIKGEYGNYSFVLEFKSEGKVGVFTLSRTNNSFKVNDNLMIIIEADYVFDYYDNRVSLMSYYN